MTLDYRNPMHEPERRSKGFGTYVRWIAVVIVILALLVFVLLPETSRGPRSVNRTKCIVNLREIGVAAELYANNHHGQLPPDLLTIVQAQPFPPAIFICPASHKTPASGATTQQVVASLLAGDHFSYAWVGTGLKLQRADIVLAFDLEEHKRSGNDVFTGINVLLGDGSVTSVNEATAKFIWAQFYAGVRPIHLSAATASGAAAPTTSP